MAVPAAVVRKIGWWIAGRITVGVEFWTTGGRIDYPLAPMTVAGPLTEIDFGASAIKFAEIVDIGVGVAVAIAADHGIMNRAAPLRIGPGMAGGIAACFGGRLVGTAVFEDHIFNAIDMLGWVDVLVFRHVAERDGRVVALKAAPAADGFGVTVVAGESGE